MSAAVLQAERRICRPSAASYYEIPRPAGENAGLRDDANGGHRSKIVVREPAIKTVTLKSDMPSVHEALQRLDRELALARQGKLTLLKLVHGYGSTGVGGDIRIAVQRRLMEMAQNGQIRGCIFGENWSKSDETSWKLMQAHSDLKSDSDLGRGNRGITIVIF